jgi:hypothetical protein
VPSPHPDNELELPEFNCDGFSDDSEIDEWNEVFIEDADAEATEEQAQWGDEGQFEGDAEQAVILDSFNMQRYRRIWEQVPVETNASNLEHVVQISRELEAMHGGGRSPPHGCRACLSSTLSDMQRCGPLRESEIRIV